MRGSQEKTTLELKLEKLRQVCDRAPEHHIGLLALAETAFRKGLRLEALEAYQKVLREESVAEAHLCMAQMYRHHGLFQEAIQELRSLFETEPSYPEAHIFARELASQTALPADIQEVLKSGCGHDELALARVRLSIARSLVLREGQELVAIQESNQADPSFGYYIGETRKRLAYCEEVLSQLSELEEAHRLYLQEQERQRQIEEERQRELSQLRQSSPEVEIGSPDLETPLFEFEPEAGEVPQAQPLESFGSEPEFESEPEFQPEPGFAFEPEFEPEPEVETEFAPDPAPEPAEIGYQTVVEAPHDFSAEPEPVVAAHGSDEPALWDDVPKPVAYSTASFDVPYAQSPLEELEDLSISTDFIPTLEGDLPEPQAEPDYPPALQPLPLSVAAAWEEAPVEAELVEVASPEAEAAPLDGQQAVELQPSEVADEVSGVVDFEILYAPLRDSLDTLMQTLAKTRSVSSVFLVNREGFVICDLAKDSISKSRVSEFIVETVHFLEAFASDPQYWVLECAGGIVVLQAIDSGHFLLTIGQTGANFGALRYTMDRVRPNFEQILQPLATAF